MKRTLLIVVLLVVVGGFAGFQRYSSWSLNKPKEDATAKPAEGSSPEGARGGAGQGRGAGAGGGRRGGGGEAVPVLVATAVQKSVSTQLRAVGNVEAYNTVSIKSQVTGVLQKVHFKDGQDVKDGQLLFTIDPRPLEAALKQSEAALARDSAQLRNLREQVRRYADLVEKQYVSREQYDQIKANADAAEAVVDADKAAVENAKVQLSYCYIYAPVSGRVGSVLINEGNLIRLNDGAPLVVINQLSPINVTFNVPEQVLAALKRHMAGGRLTVNTRFSSDEGRAEQGFLAFVDNIVDRATGTIKLKAEFTNKERRLWPGQFVNVALILATQSDAVVIPSEAVQVGPEGQQVFVVKEDRRIEVRLVTLGQTNEGEAVIAKGIAAGEQVVREGQFLLGPGSRVEIKEPSKIADETKGEGRRRGGRGKSKSDGESADSAKASEAVKGEGRRERKNAEGEVREAAKSGEESKGEGQRRRRGEGKGKSEGEARGKGQARGES
ncbi:MAG: efflux RND transporter periplasmic adaptor subunit [Deltaproteobacteria bacterium]|nr:efflux RND transporter periplasmic adaptor subunit [Deltaproteobacteria bacterium]